MDRSTVAAYDRDAAAFAADWHAQPPPADMHALIRRVFRPGPTADVGCGSGRDAAWLEANGYPTIGYDASDGLLAAARARYPGLRLVRAALPELAGAEDGAFANVLCETVIMHLPAADVAPSVRRLVALLAPGGTLYLSWRVTRDADRRDEHGRLYAALDPAAIRGELDGMRVLLDEAVDSASSGKPILRLVARRDA